MNQYKVLVEVTEMYEIDVCAKSDDHARRIALKSIKNHEEDPTDQDIDVLDIYESISDDE